MSDYVSADLQERVRARTVQPSTAPEAKQAVPVHPVVQMQRHLGNAQVARLIAQRQAEEGGPVQAKRDPSIQRAEEEEELQAKHDPAIQRAEEEEELQAKHDPSIQRAEEEEELQAKHDPAIQRAEEEEELQAKHDPAIQRAEEEEEMQAKHDPAIQRAEEEEMVQGKHDSSIQRAGEEEELQAKHIPEVQREPQIGLEGGPVGGDMASQINSARGGGSSLDGGVRSQVEGALGADLSGVRVHQDSQSDQLNRSMTAKAFTTGSDIFLRGDANPSDTSLMAHELTHVVQQSSGAVGGGGGGMSVGAADDSHEHEADSVANAITSGATQRKQEESLGV